MVFASRTATRRSSSPCWPYDKKSDLAILELDKAPPAARSLALGARAFPAPGDAVTAIGHPQGLNFSATSGIVSGIRRAPTSRRQARGGPRLACRAPQPSAAEAAAALALRDRAGDRDQYARPAGPGHRLRRPRRPPPRPAGQSPAAKPQPLPGSEGSDLFNPLADLEPRVNGCRGVLERRGRIQPAAPGRRQPNSTGYHPEDSKPRPQVRQALLPIAEPKRRTPPASRPSIWPAWPTTPGPGRLQAGARRHPRRLCQGAVDAPGLPGSSMATITTSVPALIASHPAESESRASRVRLLLTWRPPAEGPEVRRDRSDRPAQAVHRRVQGRSLRGRGRGPQVEYAIGEPAAKMLFALEHLSVGKKRPRSPAATSTARPSS